MLETERAPDSASDEVVLADTSAPESILGGFNPTRPATRSDMGFAKRLSAETWGKWGQEEQNPMSEEAWRTGRGGPGEQGSLEDRKPGMRCWGEKKQLCAGLSLGL